jgi:hypothetical protein
MRKLVVSVLAASLLMRAGAAGAAEQCYSPAALEAEQGIRFVIELMVASTACRDQTYGLFQQRNKEAVVAYQKAMIAHLHGNAAYDRWDTMLANEASMKQAGKSSPQSCQESAELIKAAAAMDNRAFRAYAASQAASPAVTGRYRKCGG